MSYSLQQRLTLLELARYSIAQGLATGQALSVNTQDYEPELQQSRACFVTLHLGGKLRGCIGNLQASRSLVDDVNHNAFAAAFRDPRFPPLQHAELDDLAISISVLTPAKPMSFVSELDLIQQLEPGVDGLILKEGSRRGTFLPSVWEQLPTPQQFMQHLKQKAGLPVDYWSETLEISRYHTEVIE